MKVYQVADWNQFENHKSRERDACNWFCTPNGLTAKVRRLLKSKGGPAIYGVHHLILGLCSRQKRPRAGWLTDDGTPDGEPLTAQDLAREFALPASLLEDTLAALSSPRIGWLSAHEAGDCRAAERPSGGRASASRVPPEVNRIEVKRKQLKENGEAEVGSLRPSAAASEKQTAAAAPPFSDEQGSGHTRRATKKVSFDFPDGALVSVEELKKRGIEVPFPPARRYATVLTPPSAELKPHELKYLDDCKRFEAVQAAEKAEAAGVTFNSVPVVWDEAKKRDDGGLAKANPPVHVPEAEAADNREGSKDQCRREDAMAKPGIHSAVASPAAQPSLDPESCPLNPASESAAAFETWSIFAEQLRAGGFGDAFTRRVLRWARSLVAWPHKVERGTKVRAEEGGGPDVGFLQRLVALALYARTCKDVRDLVSLVIDLHEKRHEPPREHWTTAKRGWDVIVAQAQQADGTAERMRRDLAVLIAAFEAPKPKGGVERRNQQWAAAKSERLLSTNTHE